MFCKLPTLPSLFQGYEGHVYKLHRLEEPPNKEVEVTREDMRHYLRRMKILREMENEAKSLYQQKKIRGFCHLYIGQVWQWGTGRSTVLSIVHCWPLMC